MNLLYTRISTLCAQCGITPGKLCADLGLSRGIITDLKMGRKKDLYATTAYKIAKYFGVSVGYLLGLEEK
ncbi:MAG: helix-turn-helix transcriptional regulator [Oscillospiraceae bacterium]|nr:helix-turn-helix transcriptional regulator [Oscillospiraceae bacterium]